MRETVSEDCERCLDRRQISIDYLQATGIMRTIVQAPDIGSVTQREARDELLADVKDAKVSN
jgi:hypothetical protein